MTTTDRLSPAFKVAVPVRVGVVSLVISLFTVGAAGPEVFTISSPEVLSTLTLPTKSVTVACTL